jgi:sulfur carrier protein ThiS
MITIKIEVQSWISAALGKPESGRQSISKKIQAGASLTNLLNLLGETYPEFGQQVYNPDGGHLSEQIIVTVNHNLVQESEFTHTVLHENDEIALIPILVGG